MTAMTRAVAGATTSDFSGGAPATRFAKSIVKTAIPPATWNNLRGLTGECSSIEFFFDRIMVDDDHATIKFQFF
jgi:hypothetical protein